MDFPADDPRRITIANKSISSILDARKPLIQNAGNIGGSGNPENAIGQLAVHGGMPWSLELIEGEPALP